MEDLNPSVSLIGNRYRIEKLIGTGGMSVIYKAWDQDLQRTVALKLLRQKYSRSPEIRAQFAKEAQAAAKLSHVNIVTIFDINSDNDRIYLALEYIPGLDLKHYIQSRKSIDIRDSLDFMIQACSGINHAHENGIIHCDIKPSNLLLNRANQVKISDFGLARILQQINQNEHPSVIWGSPFYLSPEQTVGMPPTIQSDIYSLGVVLYELLTGRPPFIANDVTQLLSMHRDVQPTDPRILNPEISEELSQIVLKTLSKDYKKRFKSATQLRNALFSIRQSLTLRTISQSMAVSPPKPSSISQPIEVDEKSTIYHDTVTAHHALQSKKQSAFDWVTILIAFLATIAVAGLVPFWIYIYFNIPGK